MTDLRLTELECCVLAVIERAQPCSAYQIRKAFQDSLTASWRASTGSIYPLVRKLEKVGLLAPSAIPGDRRKTRLITLTPRGFEELLRWVREPAALIAEPVPDPIRTRSYALGLLQPAERSDVLNMWLGETREAIARVELEITRHKALKDGVEVQTHEGARLQLEARLSWLGSLLKGRL